MIVPTTVPKETEMAIPSIEERVGACEGQIEKLLEMYKISKRLWFERAVIERAISKWVKPKVVMATGAEELIDLLQYAPTGSNVRQIVIKALNKCVERAVRERARDRKALEELYKKLPKKSRVAGRLRHVIDFLK